MIEAVGPPAQFEADKRARNASTRLQASLAGLTVLVEGPVEERVGRALVDDELVPRYLCPTGSADQERHTQEDRRPG